MVAAQIADRIVFLGATLPEFKVEIAVMVVFLLCVVFGPLLVFAPQLAQVKRTGLREYSCGERSRCASSSRRTLARESTD